MAGVLASLLSSACVGYDVPVQPGEPWVKLEGSWIRGASSVALLNWSNVETCGGHALCDDSELTMTVLSVECHGCSIRGDIENNGGQVPARVRAVATTDDLISIEADLRFDATGEVRHVSGSTTSDREVALEAQCRLIDTATLAGYVRGSDFWVPDSLFQACGATRLPSQTVVVFPAIRTYRDKVRFPFCPGTDAAFCHGLQGEEFRVRSSLSIEPAPVSWGFSHVLPTDSFAVLPDLGSTQTVSLRTPLAGGEVATTTVAIPPVM